MTLSYRRLASASVTALALGAGVAATPALAAPSPLTLTQAITQQQPKIQEDVGAIGTPTRDHRTITGLRADTKACETAIDVVAPIRASGTQAQGKRDWLTGVRLQVVFNDQLIARLRATLSGHAAVGRVEIAASGATGDRVDDDIPRADRLLAIR